MKNKKAAMQRFSSLSIILIFILIESSLDSMILTNM